MLLATGTRQANPTARQLAQYFTGSDESATSEE